MGAAFFYHLTRSTPETVVAMLATKSLQAGWHVVVRGQDPARLDRLDHELWLGPEEGFLPHGLAGGAHDAAQPVLLTTGDDIPNGAQCLITLEGAQVTPADCTARERVCILFDGNDEAAVDQARGQWRALTGAGCAAQYWSEESGRWQKKAESQAG